eukprot:scaffold48_cov311-Pinguiococcus_pyrenoidosus.AAC.297
MIGPIGRIPSGSVEASLRWCATGSPRGPQNVHKYTLLTLKTRLGRRTTGHVPESSYPTAAEAVAPLDQSIAAPHTSAAVGEERCRSSANASRRLRGASQRQSEASGAACEAIRAGVGRRETGVRRGCGTDCDGDAVPLGGLRQLRGARGHAARLQCGVEAVEQAGQAGLARRAHSGLLQPRHCPAGAQGGRRAAGSRVLRAREALPPGVPAHGAGRPAPGHRAARAGRLRDPRLRRGRRGRLLLAGTARRGGPGRAPVESRGQSRVAGGKSQAPPGGGHLARVRQSVLRAPWGAAGHRAVRGGQQRRTARALGADDDVPGGGLRPAADAIHQSPDAVEDEEGRRRGGGLRLGHGDRRDAQQSGLVGLDAQHLHQLPWRRAPRHGLHHGLGGNRLLPLHAAPGELRRRQPRLRKVAGQCAVQRRNGPYLGGGGEGRSLRTDRKAHRAARQEVGPPLPRAGRQPAHGHPAAATAERAWPAHGRRQGRRGQQAQGCDAVRGGSRVGPRGEAPPRPEQSALEAFQPGGRRQRGAAEAGGARRADFDQRRRQRCAEQRRHPRHVPELDLRHPGSAIPLHAAHDSVGPQARPGCSQHRGGGGDPQLRYLTEAPEEVAPHVGGHGDRARPLHSHHLRWQSPGGHGQLLHDAAAAEHRRDLGGGHLRLDRPPLGPSGRGREEEVHGARPLLPGRAPVQDVHLHGCQVAVRLLHGHHPDVPGRRHRGGSQPVHPHQK